MQKSSKRILAFCGLKVNNVVSRKEQYNNKINIAAAAITIWFSSSPPKIKPHFFRFKNNLIKSWKKKLKKEKMFFSKTSGMFQHPSVSVTGDRKRGCMRLISRQITVIDKKCHLFGVFHFVLWVVLKWRHKIFNSLSHDHIFYYQDLGSAVTKSLIPIPQRLSFMDDQNESIAVGHLLLISR